jgi:hypothetical protein
MSTDTPAAQRVVSDDDQHVSATCFDCGDTHPLGDRSFTGATTVCPACDSTSYRTVSPDVAPPKPTADRIRDVVSDINGVGAETEQHILGRFETYYAFEAASATELQRIDGVGALVADRIVAARPGSS